MVADETQALVRRLLGRFDLEPPLPLNPIQLEKSQHLYWLNCKICPLVSFVFGLGGQLPEAFGSPISNIPSTTRTG